MRRKLALYMLSFLLLVVLVTLPGCQSKHEPTADVSSDDQVIRIGYQKNGPLVILKGLGTLEEALEPLGFDVEWKEFQAGPALVEALNAGSIDVGRTGNSPVIFAQAAGTSFVTLAAGKPKFLGSGILVPNDSSIQSVADLKDTTVGLAKGSSSHYLIVKALEGAGLSYSDITPAFLQPGDARVAFEQGNIDAMVVWDPFTASTEINSNGRLLTNGEGLSSDRDFFVATEDFAQKHPEITDIFVEYIERSSDWANNNHDELVTMLAPILNIDEESIDMTVKRREYGVDDITDDIINEQQDIADLFYELDIIPKEIKVENVMRSH
ncbi:MAG TPA: sulfonate ABC transporter substrate-binding protein [Virgibacillus sp.]|nr:sulfonate ABC transporter substrate-binding protein [Virgibacillus sp.]